MLVSIGASLAAVYAAGTDTFQIQSVLNLAYRMILRKQRDYADIFRLDAGWRMKYLLPSSHIGLSPLRRAKLLCDAKLAVGLRASSGVR